MTDAQLKEKEALDKEAIKGELGFLDPNSFELSGDEAQEVDARAQEVIDKLLNNTADDVANDQKVSAIENIGMELQRRSTTMSEKLKDPIHKISHRSEDGGEIAKTLTDLRIQVEELDPARFDFDAGFFTRIMGYIPGFGTPLKRYFTRYESAQSVINSIVKSLELGREQLKRDNITLSDDQKRMRELTHKLAKTIKLAQAIDTRLQAKLDNELVSDDPKYKFIAEELLFPLRQRIQDLQQQLAVNQQGILAMELIIRNNKELIRGVNRSLTVTVNALQVAVTVALALNDQKIVLEKVEALNATTSDMIANTAARLKQQGVEIQKQAASTQLNMDSLKQAFTDVKEAMEDISQFRQSALPQMADSILEMDRLSKEAEEIIHRQEQAKRAEPVIPIEIE